MTIQAITHNQAIQLHLTPSKTLTHQLADDWFDWFFPSTEKPVAPCLAQLEALLKPLYAQNEGKIPTLIANISASLQQVYDHLLQDAAFFLQNDPASQSTEEIILTYPGFYAIFCHRIAHVLYRQEIPLLPRMISEYAHGKTGIDIHPGAQIASPFFIDHGTGIVIGQTCVIGKNVQIYQGVTLGALSVKKAEANTKRHPTIEDNVVLYAGSCILGGQTTVGHDSIIGGNCWLTESVAPYSVAYHKSQIVVRGKQPFPEPLNFVI
jgi:serine O-acetyltransferase